LETLPNQAFTAYQKFVILILALLQFTVIIDFMILSPLGAILMDTMKLTPKQFGSVVSAYAISACISGFLAAGFADKFDRKKLLLFFYVGFVAGTLFCATAYNYETLLLARIITGVFGGVIGSISMAIITDIFALQQRGKVMGFVQMAFAGSQILGVPIGLLLANTWGWHSTFFGVVIFSLIVGLTVVFKLKPLTEHLKHQHDKSPFLHLWHTVKNRNYRIGFLATALLPMGGFMLMPFSSNFIVNNVKVSMHDLPLIFMFTGISSIIIMPIIGKLSDKIDKFKLFTLGSLLACVMIFIYTNLGIASVWTVVAINMIMFMGIMGRIVPAQALNSAIPDMADRGAYMSINASMQQLAGGLGAIFAGLVVVNSGEKSPLQHFDTLGYIIVALMLICIFLMWRVSNMIKKKTTQSEKTTLENEEQNLSAKPV